MKVYLLFFLILFGNIILHKHIILKYYLKKEEILRPKFFYSFLDQLKKVKKNI